MHAVPIPPRIQKVLRKGYHEVIPLSAITTAACTLAAESETRTVAEGDLVVAEGRLTLKPKDVFDSSRDNLLTPSEFRDAGKNLAKAIESFLIPEGETRVGSDAAGAIGSMFRRMFSSIGDRPDFDADFDIYLPYTLFMIRYWIDHPNENVLLDIFDDEVYARLQMKLVRQEIKRKKAEVSAQHSFPAAKQAKAQPARTQPASRAEKSDKSFRRQAVWRCYLCAKDHPERGHKGPAKFLIKVGDRGYTDSKDNKYCIAFNTKGCTRTDCIFKHFCSLCGSEAGKGAQDCSCPS